MNTDHQVVIPSASENRSAPSENQIANKRIKIMWLFAATLGCLMITKATFDSTGSVPVAISAFAVSMFVIRKVTSWVFSISQMPRLEVNRSWNPEGTNAMLWYYENGEPVQYHVPNIKSLNRILDLLRERDVLTADEVHGLRHQRHKLRLLEQGARSQIPALNSGQWQVHPGGTHNGVV